jgi:tetratricopeptide (TPR) repeat protein
MPAFRGKGKDGKASYAGMIAGAVIFALVVYFAYQSINTPRFTSKTVDELIESGVEACNQKKYDAGLRSLREASKTAHRLQMRSREAYAHFYTGAFMLKRLREESRDEKAAALRTGEDFHLPREALAEIQKELLRALELNATIVKAHRLLGYVYREQGLLHKARETLEEAVKRNDRFAEAHNDLGEVYYALKRYDRAREYFENAVQLKETLASAHFNLGIYYSTDAASESKAESRDRAKKHFQRFMELTGDQDPPPPDRFLAEQILERLGVAKAGSGVPAK